MSLPLSVFSSRISRLVSMLHELVNLESPTEDKTAVDRLGAFVARQLVDLGAQVSVERRTQMGDHLIARWNTITNKVPLLCLCHMDTVHPLGSLAQNPWRQENGKLFGPGVLDMKAGIAILLGTLAILQEEGHWPDRSLTILITSDEEVGSLTSRPLIETLARQSALALCLEPSLPGGALKTWRKGVGNFQMVVYGRAAHAGAAHSEGLNAIEELAYQVLAIQKMTDYDRGTTLNVGVIRGGTASNVVPAEARAEVDLRVMVPEEAERVLKAMLSLEPVLEGTRIEVTGGLNRPPMPRDARMAVTFQIAQEIASRLGQKLGEGGTGGGSDANFVAPLGIPVLDGLGGEGEGQHSEREYVLESSLIRQAALLAALLIEWPQDQTLK